MEDAIVALVVLGTITFGIVSVINAVSNHKLKKKLIDKAETNDALNAKLADSMKLLSEKSDTNKYATLKWGLVTLGAGIGLILSHYLSFDFDGPLPFGILLTFISLGFLIYYFIVRAEEKNIG